jgi:CarD family transcriptional regulator
MRRKVSSKKAEAGTAISSRRYAVAAAAQTATKAGAKPTARTPQKTASPVKEKAAATATAHEKEPAAVAATSAKASRKQSPPGGTAETKQHKPKAVKPFAVKPAPVAQPSPVDNSQPTQEAGPPHFEAEETRQTLESPAPALSATVAELPEPAPADEVAKPAPPVPQGPQRPYVPPRLPAEPEVFADGDHVVYPTHGVGKVERIATEEIAGQKLELIHITFEENRMTLRVPVAKARSAGLRKLATRKVFEEALAVLKGRARIKRTMWSRRAQEYEAKINSGDPLAIAEVVRDLHRNAGQPDQSFSERQIYEAAMDRLAAELAALDKTDKLTAATKLVDFLKTV